MMQTRATRAAGDALLDELLLTGGDPAVKALVPALLTGRNVHRFMCVRLLARGPIMHTLAAEHIGRLDRSDLLELITGHPFLPEEVLLEVIAKHGKSAKVIVAVCKRSDLTDNVARALAKRRSKVVVRALQTNQFVPAAARWKVSSVVEQLGISGRDYDGDSFARAYLVARALIGLGEAICGKVAKPNHRQTTSRTGLLNEVFKLLPVDRVADDVAAGLYASDFIDAQLLKMWAWRNPTGEAAQLLLRLADRLAETDKLSDCRDHLTTGHPFMNDIRIWSDDASVDAAWEAGGEWRLVALASSALDQSRLNETITCSTAQAELEAAAVSTSLDATQTTVLLSKLEPRRRWRLCAAPLDDAARTAMLTGEGAFNVAKLMAQTVKQTVTPNWFAQWWTKTLAIAALAAAVDEIAVASPLAEKMVAAWPDTLEFALGHVTIRHELGPVVLAELASRLGGLDDTAAAVVATMLHSWTGALADLVSTAELI